MLSTKVQRLDEVHESSLLSYVSNVIKRFIQLAEVIIGVNFLTRFIYFEILYRNFSVGVFILRYEVQHRYCDGRTSLVFICRLLQLMLPIHIR